MSRAGDWFLDKLKGILGHAEEAFKAFSHIHPKNVNTPPTPPRNPGSQTRQNVADLLNTFINGMNQANPGGRVAGNRMDTLMNHLGKIGKGLGSQFGDTGFSGMIKKFGGDVGKITGVMGKVAKGDPSAIVDVVKIVVDKVKDMAVGIGKMSNRIGEATSGTDTPYSSLFKGGEEFSEGVGGVLGMAGYAVFRLGRAAVETVDKMKKWGDELHASSMRFATYSPAMAAVEARQEVRDILLQYERGQRRAEGAERVAASKYMWDRIQANIADNFFNNVSVPLYTAASTLGSVALGIANAQTFGYLDKFVGDNKDSQVTGAAWDDAFPPSVFSTHGRPDRFN